MKYGQNKQFLILKNTYAAAPCEINEGVHQTAQNNVANVPYYALMAKKSLRKSSKSNFADLIRWESFQTSKIMKYGHNKQILMFKYASAAVSCEINEVVLVKVQKKCRRLSIL